jgi:mannan endo-1,4-beta-mannosidase
VPSADPSNWFIPEDGAFQFAHDYISARAKIAHAAGKPIMLEETGMNVSAGQDPK